MINILIVEEDKSLRRLMEVILKQKGYYVYLAQNGEEAIEIFEDKIINLVI